MKVVGVLTADPPDSQPGDRCRTRSGGIYPSNFPRTPIVKLVADTEDVDVTLSSTKRNRFTYNMCKTSASANWPTVKIYYRVTCEFLPFTSNRFICRHSILANPNDSSQQRPPCTG